MLKYTIRNQADPGTHALPFPVTDRETTLSTIIIPTVEVHERIVIEVSLIWENPLLNWDIGELDIRLRRNDERGPVLDWVQESCYHEGTAELRYEEGKHPDGHTYCLTVQSPDRRATITGPLIMIGSLYDHTKD